MWRCNMFYYDCYCGLNVPVGHVDGTYGYNPCFEKCRDCEFKRECYGFVLSKFDNVVFLTSEEECPICGCNHWKSYLDYFGVVRPLPLSNLMHSNIYCGMQSYAKIDGFLVTALIGEQIDVCANCGQSV